MLSHGCLAAFTVVALLVSGCHHGTTPAAPAPTERPPLPPASGTPIGFLVDDADELKLTSDQVTRLEQIDEDLAGRLEAIDGEMRAAHRPAEPDGASANPSGMQGGGRRGHGGMRGGMGGGMRGGGMGGPGMGGPGMGHGGRGRGGGGPRQGHGAGGPSGSADAARLAQRRDDEVRDAFARAFTIMDAAQQEAAKKLLVAHDIDIDQIETPSPVESGADAPPSDSAVPPSQ